MSKTLRAAPFAKKHGLWRSGVFLLGKLIVAAGLLTWLFAAGRLDPGPLSRIHQGRYVLAAGACLLASMLLGIWRWLFLLRIQELKVPWVVALRMTWLGYFAAVFLPGLVGGDLAKAYVACRNKPRGKMRAVSTVVMDRVLGLHSLLLMGSAAGIALLAGGCTARLKAVIWLTFALLAVTTAGLSFILWRPTSGITLKLLPQRFRWSMGDSISLYRDRWVLLPAVVLYSCVVNGLGIATYVLAAMALGDSFSYGQVLAVPLVAVANSLPISPGGLGVGETVGAQLFAEFGSANGGLVILVVRLGLVVFSLPGVLALFGTYRDQGAFRASQPDQ